MSVTITLTLAEQSESIFHTFFEGSSRSHVEKIDLNGCVFLVHPGNVVECPDGYIQEISRYHNPYMQPLVTSSDGQCRYTLYPNQLICIISLCQYAGELVNTAEVVIMRDGFTHL